MSAGPFLLDGRVDELAEGVAVDENPPAGLVAWMYPRAIQRRMVRLETLAAAADSRIRSLVGARSRLKVSVTWAWMDIETHRGSCAEPEL